MNDWDWKGLGAQDPDPSFIVTMIIPSDDYEFGPRNIGMIYYCWICKILVKNRLFMYRYILIL